MERHVMGLSASFEPDAQTTLIIAHAEVYRGADWAHAEMTEIHRKLTEVLWDDRHDLAVSMAFQKLLSRWVESCDWRLTQF